MARNQNKSVKFDLENLEGRNLTTSLNGAASLAVAASPPAAEVSTNVAQQMMATHNYAVQTGFFLR